MYTFSSLMPTDLEEWHCGRQWSPQSKSGTKTADLTSPVDWKERGGPSSSSSPSTSPTGGPRERSRPQELSAVSGAVSSLLPPHFKPLQ